MKQRFFILFLLFLAIFLFGAIVLGPKDAGAIRIKAPTKDDPGSCFYYNKRMNPFYPEYAPYHKTGSGYVTGNCTWYAWGRACEILGYKPDHLFTGNASGWWKQNKKEGYYPYGSHPKRGAIICYKTHVAIVEQAEPLIISESGWTVETEMGPLAFNSGEPWRKKEAPLGFIYIR